MPEIGDIRVVEYDPGEYEIECFTKHKTPTLWVSDPFWALPNWLEIGIPEFVGPFASYKEASSQVRILKNNKDERLLQYIQNG